MFSLSPAELGIRFAFALCTLNSICWTSRYPGTLRGRYRRPEDPPGPESPGCCYHPVMGELPTEDKLPCVFRVLVDTSTKF